MGSWTLAVKEATFSEEEREMPTAWLSNDQLRLI